MGPIDFATQAFVEASPIGRSRSPSDQCAADTAHGTCKPSERWSTVGSMDIPSMIMGASIASIVWIAIYPWAKLKKLREMDGVTENRSGSEPPS
jgi:hypothetical protein